MFEQPDHTQQYYPQWDRPTRLIVAVFLIIGAIFALTLVAPVLQMLLIAFLIAFVMLIPARALTIHTPLPYAGSVIICYTVLLTVGLVVVLVLIPPFVAGVNRLVNDVEEGIATAEAWLVDYEPEDGLVTVAGIQVDLDFIFGPLHDFLTTQAAELSTLPDTPEFPGAQGSRESPNILDNPQLGQLLGGALNVAGIVTTTVTATITSVTGMVTTLLLAIFISFLVLLDLPHTQMNIASSVPPAYRREYAILFERIERVWAGFFRGQVTIGLVIGLLTLLQLKLMGVPGAEILAVFTGFISLIPTLGGFIALVPLAIVPLVQGSQVFTEMSHIVFTLLVVGVNLVISQVIWNIVAPKILGDALDLPLPVIIVGVFIGAAAGGIMGAFLVAPIMSMLRVIVVYLFNKINARDPFPDVQPAVPLGRGFFGQAHLESQQPEASE